MTKLFIASNDIILLNTISIFLALEDYKVELCSEPTDIYQKILDFEPAIVFFDNDLKIHNSKSLCNKVKENIATSHIRVIIYSKEKGRKYIDCKPDDYFNQPFSLSELRVKIKKQSEKLNTQLSYI